MSHYSHTSLKSYFMNGLAILGALMLSTTALAQFAINGAPNQIYWQKQNSNLKMELRDDGKTLYYNRNWAPYAQYEIFADVPTNVGHLYQLEIHFDENRALNTFVNLNVDGKRVASSSQTSGRFFYGFIAKKAMTRISLGGSNNWLASFVITNIFLNSIGDHLRTGTFVDRKSVV